MAVRKQSEEWIRQRTVEAFVRAAAATMDWQRRPEADAEELIWGTVGLIRLSKLDGNGLALDMAEETALALTEKRKTDG